MRGSTWSYKSALAGTALLVRAGNTKLFGYHIMNTAAAITYVHFYDAAAAADVTVGTSPSFVLGLPSSGGAVMALGERGVTFNLGIVVASTTAVDGSTGAITVSTFFIGWD